MTAMNDTQTQTQSCPRLLFVACLIIALGAADLCAQKEAVTLKRESSPKKVHHSSDFGWIGGQDVTEEFTKLLESRGLKPGEELALDHRYRISGSHTLPDHFTLSTVKGAGFDVTDATKLKGNRPLLELGDGNTLRNLTITYLDTPELGPTGEEPGVTFAKRLGIQAIGKDCSTK